MRLHPTRSVYDASVCSPNMRAPLRLFSVFAAATKTKIRELRGTTAGGNMDARIFVLAGVSLQPVLRYVPGSAGSRGGRGEDFLLHGLVSERQDRASAADRERGLHRALVQSGHVHLAAQVMAGVAKVQSSAKGHNSQRSHIIPMRRFCGG